MVVVVTVSPGVVVVVVDIGATGSGVMVGSVGVVHEEEGSGVLNDDGTEGSGATGGGLCNGSGDKG